MKKYLRNELWVLTVAGALGRSGTYRTGASGENKILFKSSIRVYLDTQLLRRYVKGGMSDARHLANIEALCLHANAHKRVLLAGHLRFGVAQKLLNLYLKYRWVIGDIAEPPHFPVDRQIQIITKYSPIVSWTNDMDQEQYMSVIDHVRKKERRMSIARYELKEFSRTGDQD